MTYYILCNTQQADRKQKGAVCDIGNVSGTIALTKNPLVLKIDGDDRLLSTYELQRLVRTVAFI